MDSIQHLDWAPLGLRSILAKADFIDDCPHGVRFWADSRHLLWMSACAGSCTFARDEGSAFVLCVGHAREMSVRFKSMGQEVEEKLYIPGRRLSKRLVARKLPPQFLQIAATLGVCNWARLRGSKQDDAIGTILGLPQIAIAPAIEYNVFVRSRGAS